ncbi:guanine nucleotide-binding protein G(o) subunit alpha [Reticulomyxa filosa]|uniref:Guanine nucleotide-binding protein G(O) subunit alpha n=1 Tax=Reticulomyxa filosa TaxID=46433 RepID=X6MR74_RETFI|nr:guanine nucleotide-binding protein G(o) subunit alpha [Reticulomyxa filosa]|eukprot:ETO15917.1 guanine nucleotide-binding protein G(o) subunit alpha [Reticulomyxa filosa]
MGCMNSTPENSDANGKIEDELKQLDQVRESRYKLLLLGAGESGKSTMLRHMRQIHGQPFSQEELMDALPHIRKNIIESMRALAIYSEILADEGQDTRVSKENEELRRKIAKINDRDPFGSEEYEMFQQLWNDKGIQRTLEFRHRFQIIDTAEYLFANMKRISEIGYIPTFEDLLHSRKRSTGIHDVIFRLKGKNNKVTEIFQVYDVGGQRSERKKWVALFDNCDAIIFVAALSGFNQTLWEDNRQNNMKEALALFQQIINMDEFKNSHAILFLNKNDLFTEKIKKFKLSDYLEDFKGRDYHYEDAIQFIQQSFASLRNDPSKLIYGHITCATDPKNVKAMFDSMRNIVVRQELSQAGFV